MDTVGTKIPIKKLMEFNLDSRIKIILKRYHSWRMDSSSALMNRNYTKTFNPIRTIMLEKILFKLFFFDAIPSFLFQFLNFICIFIFLKLLFLLSLFVHDMNYLWMLKIIWGCPRGVMVKAMDCGILVREFELQSRYYIHFRTNTLGKGMNPLSSQLWVK